MNLKSNEYKMQGQERNILDLEWETLSEKQIKAFPFSNGMNKKKKRALKMHRRKAGKKIASVRL